MDCIEEMSRDIWESIVVLKIKKKDKVNWESVSEFYREYIERLANSILACAERNGYNQKKHISLSLLRERFRSDI